MAVAQPLNILLADTDYRQYLLMKDNLSVRNGIRARILWCGEPDQYLHAMQSGIYDLIFLQYDMDSFFLLDQLENGGCHTPVVLLAAAPTDHMVEHACHCGALDMLCRKQPDLSMLRHHLLYADMYRKGELYPHMFPDDDSLSPPRKFPDHPGRDRGNVVSIAR